MIYVNLKGGNLHIFMICWEPGAVLEKTSASPPALPIHRTLNQLFTWMKEVGALTYVDKKENSNTQNFLVTFNYHI